MFITIECYSQTPIRDTHILNQERRDTNTSWGNFQPNPNYNFFGIQTNIHYTFTWGWFAPSQNEDYREGPDIRPYKPGGKGWTTWSNYNNSRTFTGMMKDDSEIIGENAEQELAYNTGLTFATDPLYILYYKDKLEPIRNWDSSNFINEIEDIIINSIVNEVGLTVPERNQLIFKVTSSGITQGYIDHMDILKERFDMSTTLNMGRGKRIISYHELMLDYRKLNNGFIKKLQLHARMMVHLLRKSSSTVWTLQTNNGIDEIEDTDDVGIMNNILANYGELIKM
jgi:hypothetical protein